MTNIPNLAKICQNFLKDLPPRQKDIISRRFGLETGQRETLESIGKHYKITRERVRQIETDGLSKIQPKLGKIQKVFEIPVNFLKKWGNLKREDLFLSQLAGERFQNHLYFLLTLGNQFFRFSEREDFYPFWTIDNKAIDLAQEINRFLISQLQKKQTPLSFPEIFKIYQTTPFYQKGKTLNPQALLSFVEISKEIEEGIDSLFGLKDWPEISPRGVKDKAYLALKKAGKPLHFNEITSLISKLDFLQKPGRERRILSQTVHNELIRDPRFVLVGRGIYALREQGYIPGFVKEIIEQVLKEKKRPLVKEEIVKEVLKQRLVKVNTILMNLQNKNYFSKDSQGKYIIKEG